jgi:hypothetical protein
MKRLIALCIIATLPLSNGAYAQSAKPPTSKSASISKSPDLSQEKVPLAKKRKKKLPPKPKQKWPPPGFEKKGELYAKTASPKELLIAATENKYIQRKLIKNCHKTACLGIFLGSETGCDWWEITSNVLGIDPNNSEERVIYGSLTTLVAGSKAKAIKTILLISDEPIAEGLGIGAYTANCRTGSTAEKIPSNTYTQSLDRISD